MEIKSLLLLSPLLFCITSILLYMAKRSINKQKRLPPGPKGLPIIGNLLKLGDRPHESLTKLAKIHGPLMTIKLGCVTTVVASSTEMARETLQKNDQAFWMRPIVDAATAETDPTFHNLDFTRCTMAKASEAFEQSSFYLTKIGCIARITAPNDGKHA
nr:geraniol 8-hydroxylase-like [Coffea arabica]